MVVQHFISRGAKSPRGGNQDGRDAEGSFTKMVNEYEWAQGLLEQRVEQERLRVEGSLEEQYEHELYILTDLKQALREQELRVGEMKYQLEIVRESAATTI